MKAWLLRTSTRPPSAVTALRHRNVFEDQLGPPRVPSTKKDTRVIDELASYEGTCIVFGLADQMKGPNMARGGVNSLLKNSTNSLDQNVSITNGEIRFCSNFIRVASHLSNNSSNYDYYNNQRLSHY
jgi:hypothetical protein